MGIQASTTTYTFTRDELRELLINHVKQNTTIPDGTVISVQFNLVDVSSDREMHSRYDFGNVTVKVSTKPMDTYLSSTKR